MHARSATASRSSTTPTTPTSAALDALEAARDRVFVGPALGLTYNLSQAAGQWGVTPSARAGLRSTSWRCRSTWSAACASGASASCPAATTASLARRTAPTRATSGSSSRSSASRRWRRSSRPPGSAASSWAGPASWASSRPGALADLLLVDGDPLADIADPPGPRRAAHDHEGRRAPQGSARIRPSIPVAPEDSCHEALDPDHGPVPVARPRCLRARHPRRGPRRRPSWWSSCRASRGRRSTRCLQGHIVKYYLSPMFDYLVGTTPDGTALADRRHRHQVGELAPITSGGPSTSARASSSTTATTLTVGGREVQPAAGDRQALDHRLRRAAAHADPGHRDPGARPRRHRDQGADPDHPDLSVARRCRPRAWCCRRSTSRPTATTCSPASRSAAGPTSSWSRSRARTSS